MISSTSLYTYPRVKHLQFPHKKEIALILKTGFSKPKQKHLLINARKQLKNCQYRCSPMQILC